MLEVDAFDQVYKVIVHVIGHETRINLASAKKNLKTNL